MPYVLVFAFIVVPLVELWAIGQVNGLVGLGWTIALLLADSVVGAALVRREGSRAWREFRGALAEGRVPGDELVGGALLLFGGALLLTPGFVTDAVGLALVLPVTRRPVARLVRGRVAPPVVQAGVGSWNAARAGPAGGSRGDADEAGEGVEVVAVERDDPPTLSDDRD